MPVSQFEYSGGWRRFFIDTERGRDAVLLLHGIPTPHMLWQETIRWLPPEIRAVAPDLTGFGWSDAPGEADLSPAGQARDMLSFLDRRRIPSVVITGHDYGALVALEILAVAPERVAGLIIANTSIRIADWSGQRLNPLRVVSLPVVDELAFWCARRWMLELAFRRYVADFRTLNLELLDSFWQPFERGFAATLLRLFRSTTLRGTDVQRWKSAFSGSDGPVSIVWGGQDPNFRCDRARDFTTIRPDARLTILGGSNHFVPIDRPRVLARHLARLAQAV